MSTNEYITGKGQSVFNSSHDALIAIPTTSNNNIIKYIYSVKYDGFIGKWYISWIFKNPQYKKPESFYIEI